MLFDIERSRAYNSKNLYLKMRIDPSLLNGKRRERECLLQNSRDTVTVRDADVVFRPFSIHLGFSSAFSLYYFCFIFLTME